MSEWFKEHAWKACVRVTVPEVRILSLPPGSIKMRPVGSHFLYFSFRKGGFEPKVRIERSEIHILSLPPFQRHLAVFCVLLVLPLPAVSAKSISAFFDVIRVEIRHKIVNISTVANKFIQVSNNSERIEPRHKTINVNIGAIFNESA